MTTEGQKRKKRMESLFSISHDKDVDGIASAAIVWRYAISKNLEHNLMLTDYGGFDQAFGKVAAMRNSLIVVTDLGMDEPAMNQAMPSISQAVSQGCRIVWLDHHLWDPVAIKSLLFLENNPVLKVNPEYCAAEITQKVLMPRDDISQELATIAHDTDFNLREIEAASALTDAVSVIRFSALDKREDITDALEPIVEALAKKGIEGVWDNEHGRFRDTLLQKQVAYYQKERLKKMKRALVGHCDHSIQGRLVRIIEIPSGVTTTDLGTFLATEDNLELEGQKLPVADLLITLSQGGMLGFRRGSEDVLCNEAAKLFDGGGHPYAAGGEYGMYANFDAACDDILLTLSKNTDWISQEKT
jgi:oligoribonuclease NrnB/cAMP/cGMP phosphodiesterase (DHH superfamily)